MDLRKNVEGAEFVLPVSMIDRASAYAADELRQEGMPTRQSRDRFFERSPCCPAYGRLD